MKKKRPVRKADWGKGAFRGGNYAEYRYGSPRPVYVPGRSPTAIFTGQRREQIAEIVTAQMRGWTATPFEHEGEVRAGLRSGLCLEGHHWQVADDEAASLVEEAFRNMRARRPTFEEGQHQYTEPRENCAWCGKGLPDDNFVGTRAKLYCSSVCASAALEHRDFQHRSDHDKAFAAARRIVARDRQPARACEECGKAFRPIREKSAQRYCSMPCANKVLARSLAAAQRPKRCVFCGDSFIAKMDRANYCSKRCSQIANRLEKGHVPRVISTPVFDHFFVLPALRLAAERFDELLAA